MKRLDTVESKNLILDAMSELARFCDQNGLSYYLAYGTLIGAIRHKGYIPWDDDIDTHMPRKDYDFIIENYNKQNPGGRYRIVAPFDKNSAHPFVKFIDTHTIKIEEAVSHKHGYLGVDVDIFPLDGQPESDEEYELWYRKLIKIYSKYRYYILDPGFSKKYRIAIPILRLVFGGKKRLLKKAAKLHSLYPYEGAKKVGSVESMYHRKSDRFNSKAFEKTLDCIFEGRTFKIPAGYDEILTQLFGDYMQLPPPEEQITHHSSNSYLLEEDELEKRESFKVFYTPDNF